MAETAVDNEIRLYDMQELVDFVLADHDSGEFFGGGVRIVRIKKKNVLTRFYF
jgi:hypothetical protein